MIVLLDLNCTFAENSAVVRAKTGESFAACIAKETYRAWLLDLIRPHVVVLMTARPEKHRAATLANIAAKTGGWQPADAYFNYSNLPPASAKFAYLTQYVFPKYGDARTDYLALESNPKTRAMYARQDILAIPIEDERCRTLLATT